MKIFWHKDVKQAEIMLGALIFQLHLIIHVNALPC